MDVEWIRNPQVEPTEEIYDAARTILYALGIGAQPEGRELDYVYEKQLLAIPTLATMLATEGLWLADQRCGVDVMQILHGAQMLELHRPLPSAGRLIGTMKVNSLIDKGPKGALIHYHRTLRDGDTHELIATVGMVLNLRGNGGFGGGWGSLPTGHPTPAGDPDITLSMETRPEQAAIYRLSGDLHPLHIDPIFASEAGFERPILHGLCTYGIACRAAIATLCEGAPQRLRRFDARFTAPVFPGDRLTLDFWREGDGQAAFSARVIDRDVTVLDKGLVRWSR